MKKILCLIISAILLVSCFAGCSQKDADNASSAATSHGSDDFVKPESYASVVLVTINPQFRLYLDAEGVVLAVEAVNADAKTIKEEISFENEKVETVVQNIIVAANDGGFIKEDATVDIKVASVEDSNNTASDLLDKVKTSVTTKLSEMQIEAEVTVSVSEEILSSDETSSETTSSEETSSDKAEMAVCNHTNKKAAPISTGKNIIDSSGLDVVNHNVTCADCSAVIGLEAHRVEENKCTLCQQSNFEIKKTNFVTAGPTIAGDAKLRDDGSVAYDIMIASTWYSAAKIEYAIDEWNYKIPEADILAAIRTKFVITDAQFADLKAQGRYEFFIGTHTYSDGYFYIKDPAAGGPGSYTHRTAGYTDDKAGKFTVYIDYMSGGADEEEHEHLYYYAIEFKYSGYSNLSVVEGEYYGEITGFAPVVDSLRITAMKKVSGLPADMKN